MTRSSPRRQVQREKVGSQVTEESDVEKSKVKESSKNSGKKWTTNEGDEAVTIKKRKFRGKCRAVRGG